MSYEEQLDSLIQELSTEPVETEPVQNQIQESDLDNVISLLEEQVAKGPMTFDQYKEDRRRLDERSFGQKTLAFGESALTGGKALIDEGSKAFGELFRGNVGLDELEGAFRVGYSDFKRFGKSIAGATIDMVMANDEEGLRNEYKRYRENFDYYNQVRPMMVDASTDDAKNFVSFGANFADPTMLVPLGGPVLKLGSTTLKSAKLAKLAKGLEKAEKVVSAPAKLASKGARKAVKGTALVGSKVAQGLGKVGEKAEKMAGKVTTAGAIIGSYGGPTGAFTGAFTAGAFSKLAKRTGYGMERTLSALSASGGQQRFLQRLATTAESPAVRQSALIAHKMGGTKLGDAMFNSVVNGASVGTLEAALAYASGEGAEGMGQAFGGGYVMGSFGIANQPDTLGGKSIADRDASTMRFMETKLVDNQLKAFRKLSPEARYVFSALEEAGLPSPNLVFLNRQNYLDYLKSKNPDIQNVPNAEFDPADRTIYVNQDGDFAKGSREAMQIVMEELGHHFITEAIKDDPLFARRILARYQVSPDDDGVDFVFTQDSFGNPIDKIRINAEGQKIAEAYDSLFGDDAKEMGINRDANRLAQEIGATQFSLMLSDNPKALDGTHPIINEKLSNAGAKVLSIFGGADPYSGNVFKKGIAPMVRKNPELRNLYNQYLKSLEKKRVDRASETKKSGIMLPKGMTADKAFKQEQGVDGITLQEAGNFLITDKVASDGMKDELAQREQGIDPALDPDKSLEASKARNRLSQARKDRNKAKKESEADPTDRTKKDAFDQAESKLKQAQDIANKTQRDAKRSGQGMIFERSMLVGKNLPDRIINFFTDNGRKDANGRIRAEIQKIASAIQNKRQMITYYRSSKPSARGDREVNLRTFTPLQFRISKIKQGKPQLQMDVIDERYLRMNLEDMVREGLVDDPDTLLQQARDVAKQATLDPEGRINPKGMFENEQVTALFGLKESAQYVRDPKLRKFLENRKDAHAIRTLDMFRLGGLKETGVDGISFDWENVKSNYMPFHGTPHIFKPEPDAPLGKFKMTQVGTGEGNQAYGHGLYFTDSKEVADHFRQRTALTDEQLLNFNREMQEQIKIMDEEPLVFGKYDEYQTKRGNDARKKYDELVEQREKKIAEGGAIYEVALKPKENEYLYWQKPLSEHPKELRDKIINLVSDLQNKSDTEYAQYNHVERMIKYDMEGQGIYGVVGRLLGGSNSDVLASEALRNAGVPGMKYTQGVTKKKTNYNYVIFDENDITITDRIIKSKDKLFHGRRNFLKMAGVAIGLSNIKGGFNKKTVNQPISANSVKISSKADQAAIMEQTRDYLSSLEEDGLKDSPNYEDAEGILSQISSAKQFPAQVELSSTEMDIIQDFIDEDRTITTGTDEPITMLQVMEGINTILNKSTKLSEKQKSALNDAPVEMLMDLVEGKLDRLELEVDNSINIFAFKEGELVRVEN